ncbi:hypothetical protein FCOIX_5348 [Fusarium coicis]|nr:hypothetical protein FCOIX_5348 [Fusarium coicis]
MVRLATIFLSLACSALASPFAKPSDSSLSDVTGVGHVIHERVISKTATKPAIVCELTCKACLAKPVPKKCKDASKGKTTGNGRGKVKGKGKSISRSLDLRERSLDDVEDLSGTDATAANEYVMEQIDSDTGSVNELDWNLIQHDAVSGQGSWAQQPLRNLSEYLHYLGSNPNANYGNSFANMLPAALASSSSLTRATGSLILWKLVSSIAAIYKAKVDELLSHIDGRSQSLNGVQVITRGYIKPETEAEVEAFHNRANGKVLIEYDNNQLDINGNQPNPREHMYRIWLEHKYYEHRVR